MSTIQTLQIKQDNRLAEAVRWLGPDHVTYILRDPYPELLAHRLMIGQWFGNDLETMAHYESLRAHLESVSGLERGLC